MTIDPVVHDDRPLRASAERPASYRGRWGGMRAVACGAAVLVAFTTACGGGGDGGDTTPTEPPTVVPPPPAVPPDRPVGPFTAGRTLTDRDGWLEFTVGEAPLVLIAPHGGTELPPTLPERGCAGCVTVNDTETQDLARRIAEAFTARTGARPHLLVNRLHRRKFDGNRALTEATGGTPALTSTWEWWQAAQDSARAVVARAAGANGRGLVVDLHGHGHPLQRLELGYLLGAARLREGDDALRAAAVMRQSSLARLAGDSRAGTDPIALLRGEASLGALLEARGFPAVPSPSAPAPLVGEAYFDGGYNTQRLGSVLGGPLDAVQIECHWTGVRNTPAARAAFADALAEVLVRFLEREYGWTPPS